MFFTTLDSKCEGPYTPGLLPSTKPLTANPGETAYFIEDWEDHGRTELKKVLRSSRAETYLEDMFSAI